MAAAAPQSNVTVITEGNGADNNKKKRLRIACCSTPFSGHLNPMIGLVEGLAARNDTNKNDGGNGDANDTDKEEIDVCLVTHCFEAKKLETRCKALGIRLVGLSVEGFDSAESVEGVNRGKVIFPILADHSKAVMEEALDAFQPDVVVSDFCCHASQEYAASRNIPLVINWTGPLQILSMFLQSAINVSDDQVYFSAGGLFVSYLKISPIGALVCFNVHDTATLLNRVLNCINCGNSLVLVHSFWGFERPQLLLYPNIVPVGPIGKALPLSPDFSQSHPELQSFLHAARTKNRKILLVTTGTVVKMEEWMVKLLWEAFEKLSRDHATSVVWSLMEGRQEFLSEDQLRHPAFHISKWLPQPALLASDLVDGVLTHCGWNGTLECISGGKPVVVLPFFGDQLSTARLLLEAGCATAVAAIPFFTVATSGRSSYGRPADDDIGYGPSDLLERFRRRIIGRLTVKGVVEGCAELLTNPRYKRAAQKLKALSSGPGKGCAFACDLIEHAGQHGLWHLTESGRNNNSDAPEDGPPKKATHASRLTGHRPLVFTLAMCAAAGATVAVVWTKYSARSLRRA